MSGAAMNIPVFVTCPKGIEALLMDELARLGGDGLRQTVAGVSAQGDWSFIFRACLWSRLANKVLLPVARFAINDAEDLYKGAVDIPWEDYLSPSGCFWIDFNGTDKAVRNTQFGAQKVKDALVDRFRSKFGVRPSVAKQQPDLTINVRLSKQQIVVNLDLCGESLHRRGYRDSAVAAPLKENLAAALLLRSGWPTLAAEGLPFIDPLCGGGTLLIEAALMAADIAPALQRESFPFQTLPQFDAGLWQLLRAEALERRAAGLARRACEIRGYDASPHAVRAAEANIEAAGLADWIRVMAKPLAAFKRPTHGDFKRGLLLTNPPYGERLGEAEELTGLYRRLGEVLKTDFVGWRAGIFTGNPELGKTMGLRAAKKYKLFNGAIPCELLLFEVGEEAFVQAPAPRPAQPLSAGAQMVANRLRKNLKQLAKWAEQQGVDCYRLYDADLPEYAAAVDLYAGAVHVQEYAAPKQIPAPTAQERLDELVAAVAEVLAVPAADISVKQRRRTRGKDQYQRLQDAPPDQLAVVREGPARFYVDLYAYLDTGLFLDHRPVRRRVADLAAGKRLLNLFCYTATATVQAALAGAADSVSVDLSRTYLDWARRNFQLNAVDTRHHALVQADCLAWLKTCREGFDVILLDPPSFSNSKRMTDVLDVQRDHPALIQRCMELLRPGGTLVFSTNLRRFKLDADSLARHAVEDISAATIDRDFQRNPKIHQCFLIRHRR